MSHVRPLSPALDKRIVDPQGKLVGRVRELLFDSTEGRIEYVCITIPRDGAANECEAIIPWSAVVAPAEGGAPWRVLAPKTAIQRVAKVVSHGRGSD